MTTHADPEKLKKLWDMIKSINVAMLTSEDGGHLRSRPMVASQKEFTGTLYFFTHASSHKTTEVEKKNQVCVSYADSGSQNYVSLSGSTAVKQDAALIKDHWSEAMRTWFPKGQDDPDVALLEVTIEQAEYWDAPSSTMLHLYGYAKAVVTGEPPHPGGNEKVSLT